MLNNSQVFEESKKIRDWVSKAKNMRVLKLLNKQQLKIVKKANNKTFANTEYTKTYNDIKSKIKILKLKKNHD